MTARDPSLLRSLAPGTRLRNGVELILRQGSGALIVLGYGPDIEAICSGGFHLNGADFSPARLAELAKMDGAVVTDEAAEVIYRANVHLIPDSSIETSETGTRHRTAERVARQTGRSVIVVSEGRSTVTVYGREGMYELSKPTQLLAQANQNLLTLERFRRRLSEVENRLTDWMDKEIATDRYDFFHKLVKKLKKAREKDGLAPYEGLVKKLTDKLKVAAVHDENWNAARMYYQLLEALGRLPQTAEAPTP